MAVCINEEKAINCSEKESYESKLKQKQIFRLMMNNKARLFEYVRHHINYAMEFKADSLKISIHTLGLIKYTQHVFSLYSFCHDKNGSLIMCNFTNFKCIWCWWKRTNERRNRKIIETIMCQVQRNKGKKVRRWEKTTEVEKMYRRI